MEVGRYTHALGDQVPAGSIEMPRYQSHKMVWALKIEKIHRDEDGQGIALIFEDKRYALKAFTASQLEKKPDPQPGWYFVVYDSSTNPGYFSFSPAKEFEDGYTLIP